MRKSNPSVKKEMVISGINLFSGGTLSVYTDLLDALIENGYQNRYHIIAFVYKKELFKKYQGDIELIELPLSRKNYVFRFYYEYLYFYFFSKKRNIDIWFSIHDMTPNVKAKKRYVYCHNPTPFLKRTKKIWQFSKNNYLMALLYKYIYKINIKKNTAVIVQQDWIRKEFKKMFGIKNIIVARPNVKIDPVEKAQIIEKEKIKKVFIYAAYPRVFKNFEIICEASRLLGDYADQFEVWLTIDGSENKYSSFIRNEYSKVKNIHWLGLLDRVSMMKRYAESDYLIFPSVLETWGLPITEYKEFNKPMLVADLPYAHETVGTYQDVCFFSPYKPKELAKQMLNYIKEDFRFQGNMQPTIHQPYADDWKTLLEMMTGNLDSDF